MKCRVIKSVDPDETALYEPSHLDLQFAQISLLVSQDERGNYLFFLFLHENISCSTHKKCLTEG